MGHVASSRLPADGPGTSSPSDTASRRPARSSISSGWWSLSMPASHTAILLLAYGSPNRLEDVEPYFTDIRGGRTPSREAVEELRSRYRRGGVPPPPPSVLVGRGRAAHRAPKPPSPGVPI